MKMKIHSETLPIYGTLHTQFGDFQLLNPRLEPNKIGIPFLLKEMGFIEFYVVAPDGFGKNIWVNSHNILIEPLSKEETKVVNFLLDNEPDVEV